jgi:methylated-DNA-[protein]-cysteine S-methyltransferase
MMHAVQRAPETAPRQGSGVRIPASPPTEALRLQLDRTSTPIGELMIVADDEGRLRAVHFTDHEAGLRRMLERQYGEKGFALEPAANPGGLTGRVDAYFGGELHAIDALPVALVGTPFQLAVWTALRQIPCGTTLSYSELAQRIGRPSAVRAVGLANGANPIGVVVPCHRVVGRDGRLVGYGGGMSRKRWLLDHESGARSLWPAASR